MQHIERKVQQLTKVIYHLNAKGDDAGDVGNTAASYENEIEGILRDAGERVKRFQAAAAHATNAARGTSAAHTVRAARAARTALSTAALPRRG